MSFLKSFKWNAAAISLGSLVMGAILTAWPAIAARTVCYLLGAELLLGAFSYLLSYFSGRRQGLPVGMDLAVGLLLGVLAFFMALQADWVIKFIPLLMGAVFSVTGAVKLQRSLELRQVQYRGWGMVMFYALLTIGFGVLLLFDPFRAAEMMVRILGIGLLISGFSDIATMVSVSRQIRQNRLPGVSQTGKDRF
ncbi:MAG: DUF308 domain-containing protein [Oscillospiraceae bacterium]|nr:DUF308 domain-containing protein [Oscillospiraceae bacterium]